MSHPAPYSPEVLIKFTSLIPRGTHVHDCFAGDGVRLGKLADNYRWRFTGTEIEAPFILDDRVAHGDATDPDSYPSSSYWIVTSPVYPNGIADDWNAKDTSRRRTYRRARAMIVGHDEPLHVNNMGRWGYRGTPLRSTARAMYWNLARKSIACWTGADRALVNVSDFMAGGKVEPVVRGWVQELTRQGWTVEDVQPVVTRRWKDGANRDERVENEVIIVAVAQGSGKVS